MVPSGVLLLCGVWTGQAPNLDKAGCAPCCGRWMTPDVATLNCGYGAKAMVRRKPVPPVPSILIAKIETVEQTYYISENREHRRPVGDEAIIEIMGTIEQISLRHKRRLHRSIEITLACSRSFSGEDRIPPSDKPFLLPVQLRKDRCSIMVYLPADAFWAMPPMITSGSITHVEVRFGPSRYGSAELLSIYLFPKSKLSSA
jgi:hypothetical protein